MSRFVGRSGTNHFAYANATKPLKTHQTLNGTACRSNLFTVHLSTRFVGPINLQVLIPHLFELGHHSHIRLSPDGLQLGQSCSPGMKPVIKRGNLQRFVSGLDPEDVTVLIDKGTQDLIRRSSCMMAKNALANFKFFLALRSYQLFRSKALSCSRLLVIMPSSWPESTSDFLTPSCKVGGTQSTLGTIDSMAINKNGYTPRCSCTIPTARLRISGEKRFDFLFMAQFSQCLDSPQNARRFNTINMARGRKVLKTFPLPWH